MLHHSPPPVFTCITSKWRATGWVFKHYWEFGFLPMCEFCAIYSFERRKETSAKATPLSNNSFIHKKVKKKPHSAFNISLAHVFLMVNMLTVDSAKKKKKPKLPKMLFLLLRQLYCTLHSTKYAVPFVHIDSYVTAWRRKNPGERVLVLHSLWGLGFCRGQEEEMPWRKIVITTCSETE